MAVYPDTLEPERLSDADASEAWRHTIQVGQGTVVILGAHRQRGQAEGGQLEASVTVTSYCCPRGLPVSSVVIWQQSGEGAVAELARLGREIRVLG
ncbi:MAG: hypothetical protein ACOZHQ_12510 [Thermodesulfobacteriota bacterium]